MKISCAAIKLKGQVFNDRYGKTHAEIGLSMCKKGFCSTYPSGKAQGFLTNTGMFVDRFQAFKIALEAGQIKDGKTIHSNKLFSEDLL
jgi:hypothetical protein